MTHINFKLHETSRQLHEWTRSEKMKLKEQAAEAAKGERCHGEKASTTDVQGAETVEGELDDFQTPLLSSLFPLNMQEVLQV